MPISRPETSDSRVIAHIDMDCFYVQVEQRKQPHLRGLPTAVVQYNDWKGGGLIAVSYEARKFGVKRSMRGDEAKEVCPDIQLVQVPVGRGKADLTIYRNAGSEVVSILSTKGRCERASIDEVYLDLTEAAHAMLGDSSPEILESVREEAFKSHVLGLDLNSDNIREKVRDWFSASDADHRDKLLACGALLVAELRMKVLKTTGFTCSAGIAHNKMLAKLVSGMNKPAQQTVVPFSSVKKLLDPLPIKKMKHLGGKLGTSLQTDLGVNTVGDLLKYSEAKLQEYYGKNTGTWLWNTARGINGEEVQGRVLTKSHGSGKTFPGSRALKKMDAVEKWLKELSAELSDRLQADLEHNKRIAKTLTLHANAFQVSDSDSVRKFPSKSCPLRYGVSKIQEDAFMLFQSGLREYIGPFKVKVSSTQPGGWRITGLSVVASKMEAIPSGTRSITNYFSSQDHICCPVGMSNDKCTQEAQPFRNEKGDDTHWSLSDDDCSGILEPEKSVADVEHVEEYGMRNSSQENGGVLKKEENLDGAQSLMEESDGVGNKSREKKRKRNEILEKKKGIDEIIKAAVSDKDPLTHFPTQHYYTHNGLYVSLKSGHGGALSSQLKQYIKVLLKANMEVPFGCEWPAEEKGKHREMVAPEARYIFLYETSECDSNRGTNTSEGMVVGFVHYRFVIEEEVPVLYVYELQLEPRVQGKGLGKFLMQLLELIAQKNKMGAVMLTVQKANRSAMNFYTGKIRYTVSAISPSRVDPLLGLQSSYEILCKAFDPEAKTILEENK